MDVSFQAVTPENDDDDDGDDDDDDHGDDDDDDHGDDDDDDGDDDDDHGDDDDEDEMQFIPECHFSSTITVVTTVSPTSPLSFVTELRAQSWCIVSRPQRGFH